MDSLLIASDENAKQIPNMELCRTVYRYEISSQQGNSQQAENLKSSILDTIAADAMAPHYVNLCSKFGWTMDEEKEKTMRCALLMNCLCMLSFLQGDYFSGIGSY
jgi:hypothetical protein